MTTPRKSATRRPKVSRLPSVIVAINEKPAKKSATRQLKVSRLGEVVRRIRKARKLSACDVGALAGLSLAAVGHYETGLRVPRTKAINAMAKVLGVPPEVLAWFAHTVQAGDRRNDAILSRVENLMLEQIEYYTDHPLNETPGAGKAQ
jgi:transcriptional regulator with XRE-family HTH domain